MKKCIQCGEIKSPSEFWKRNAEKDGLDTYCIPCRKISKKAEYNRNRQNRLDYSKIYRSNPENKKRIKEYGKKYREENKEKLAEKATEYWHKTKDARMEYHEKWRNGNREHLKNYRFENRDYINDRDRAVKLAYQKKQYLENPEHLRELSREHYRRNIINCRKDACKRAQIERNELSDSYIKSLICKDSLLTANDIPQEMIESKRIELQINRYIKN